MVGARLTLEVGGRRLTRFAQGGGSYLSSSDRRHVFGLGKADRVGGLGVAWPGGKEEHWDGLAVDRYWGLVEGTGFQPLGQPALPSLAAGWPAGRLRYRQAHSHSPSFEIVA
jgi:hypothetical protein